MSDKVRAIFSSIASRYDRTNGVMSLGLHWLWNRQLIRWMEAHFAGDTMLDLCSGTGEIGLGFAKRKGAQVILLDFCAEMLEVAREKGRGLGNVSFLEADAQAIPLLDAAIDGATMAYGIRNVADVERCAREVYRVMRPGGKWGILELTRPRPSLIAYLHRLYLKGLPWVGRLFASDRAAYSYLASSVQSFTAPDELVAICEKVGWAHRETRPLFWGTATLIALEKPA